jgi:PHP family Zn ribbon phosphoesterase
MSIEFNCETCGKHYKVADAMAGKRAKCKGCGGIIQVPAEIEDPPEKAAVEDDVAIPAAAPPVKPVSQRPVVAQTPAASQKRPAECPSCQASLAPNAVLCTNCGFDLRKGMKIAGVADNEDEVTESSSSASNDDPQAASPTDKGKNQKLLIAILIGVALIASAVVAYLKLKK